MLTALLLAAATPAPLDPKVLAHVSLDTIEWKVSPSGTASAMIAGDPTKPGIYVQLIKWPPWQMSRPHFHGHARYITVLRGVWWVGTGPKYDPASMTPMPAGSVVTHFPGGVHYDGAHEEGAIIEIVGEGPSGMTPAEQK